MIQNMLRWAPMLQTPSPMDQPVTVTIVPNTIITILIVGLIAGFFASLVIRGRGGFLASLAVGIVGAVVGYFLFAFLNVQPTGALADGITLRYYDLLASFVGAVLLLLLLVALFGRRFR